MSIDDFVQKKESLLQHVIEFFTHAGSVSVDDGTAAKGGGASASKHSRRHVQAVCRHGRIPGTTKSKSGKYREIGQLTAHAYKS